MSKPLVVERQVGEIDRRQNEANRTLAFQT